MEQVYKIVGKAADKIEDLAYLLENDKNIEEYFFEAGNEEVTNALGCNEYKLAALLILKDYLFND